MSNKIIGKLRGSMSLAWSWVTVFCGHCKGRGVKTYQAAAMRVNDCRNRLRGALSVAWSCVVGFSQRCKKWRKDNLSINGEMVKYGSLFFTVSLILLTVQQPSKTSAWWGAVYLLKSIPPPSVNFPVGLRAILFIISFIFAAAVPKLWKVCKLANFLKGRLKIVAYLSRYLLVLFALWIIPPMPLVAQIITFVISAIFVIAVFCKGLAYKLEEFLKGPFQYFYWLIFSMVYTVGWLRGLTGVSGEGFVNLVFWFGLIWFFVVAIVMFTQPGKNDGKT